MEEGGTKLPNSGPQTESQGLTLCHDCETVRLHSSSHIPTSPPADPQQNPLRLSLLLLFAVRKHLFQRQSAERSSISPRGQAKARSLNSIQVSHMELKSLGHPLLLPRYLSGELQQKRSSRDTDPRSDTGRDVRLAAATPTRHSTRLRGCYFLVNGENIRFFEASS